MRRQKLITMDDGGRLLCFRIRELAALQMESWLDRLARSLAATPDDQEPDLTEATPLGRAREALLEHGLFAAERVPGEVGNLLREEMLGCCSYLSPAGGGLRCASGVVDGYIEHAWTLISLRRHSMCLNLRFLLQGERRPLSLPGESGFKAGSAVSGRAATVNVSGGMAAIMGHGLAGLRELETYYSYSDALDMLEIINVDAYNRWAAQEAAHHGRR